MNLIRDIIAFVVTLVPRFIIISEFEHGVKLVWGNYQKTLTSTNGIKGRGVHLWWPLATDIYEVNIRPQLRRIDCQSVMTSDGRSVGVSGAIEYSVADPSASILEVQDIDESLSHFAAGTITRYINSRTLEHCREVDDLEKEISKGVRMRSKEWGLRIRRFFITDLVEHKAIRIMTGAAPADDWVPVSVEDE
jgi:regulator of protease activity HflC (stomatin/prohibitin superfamily)